MGNCFEFIDWRPDVSDPEKMIILASELDALKLRLKRLVGNQGGGKIAEMELARIDKARPGLASACADGDADAGKLMRQQATRREQLKADIEVAAEVQEALDKNISETKKQIDSTQFEISNHERSAAAIRAANLFKTDGHRLLLEARKAFALFVAAKQLSGTIGQHWHKNADIWDDNLVPGIHLEFNRHDIMPLIARMRDGQ